MKLKSIIVLLVCFMATVSFAATNSWIGPTGSWGTGTLWGLQHMPNDTDGEIKILKQAGSVTLDVAAGTFTNQKITLGGASVGAVTLNIVDGGSITVNKELILGNGGGGGSGPVGTVVQTGGSVTMNGKLQLGYKSGSTGVGQGDYTISGGTLSGTGTMWVGAASGTSGSTSGTIGKFTVVGAGTLEAPTVISFAKILVGTGDASAAGYTGQGTLAFEIVDGAVTAIGAGSVVIDNANGTITALLVSADSAPMSDILLVDNTGVAAVIGAFDNAAEGAILNVGGVDMTLTYVGGDGNDIVLLIPEPATIALLGLGLLAIRRKK